MTRGRGVLPRVTVPHTSISSAGTLDEEPPEHPIMEQTNTTEAIVMPRRQVIITAPPTYVVGDEAEAPGRKRCIISIAVPAHGRTRRLSPTQHRNANAAPPITLRDVNRDGGG